jgi:AcrR family transcriptional regulator
MARPADPNRRAKTINAATKYVLKRGLTGLSLRPLAQALGTSPRMLLYDFSSKEELIMEILAEIRRRESALLSQYLHQNATSRADVVRVIWDWLKSKKRAPFLRLFFEVYVDAMIRPMAYSRRRRAMVVEWLDQFGAVFANSTTVGTDITSATLVIGVLRGLILDRLGTGDSERTDLALERFARMIVEPHHSPRA